MANFATHLTVGTLVSGIAATALLVAELATPNQMLAYLGLGMVGSLLPDLDADNSTPIQIAFTLFSLVLAFLAMFGAAGYFVSLAELVVVWLLTYVGCRWLVFTAFTRLTTHRGVFHTIPAALLAGLLVTLLADRLFAQSAQVAWWSGGFVAGGYLLHLLLDEVYSVNLFGMRTRKSFGTALKLWSAPSPVASLALYLACLGLLVLTPRESLEDLDRASALASYRVITNRLLPEDRWFAWRQR